MREARPSVTALRVAIRRAAHQILDDPKVFDDPLAERIIGAEAAETLKAEVQEHQTRAARSLRAFMAVRSRFAEDELARAVERGASQYVVLGAGLDTFAYRNPYIGRGLRVFEVDYPATQAWKHRKLVEAGIPIPPSVTYAPVDFEKQTLTDGLERAGFQCGQITFFSWLGVTPYLTEEAFLATIGFIASMPAGSGVAFDYTVPRSSLSLLEKLAFDALSRRVAAGGEPFRLFFDPEDLAERLRRSGCASVTDLDSERINSQYFEHRADNLRVGGGLAHLMSAWI
jgi:methyltransferase (TIGR00027 family)